jgi:hypothetical protein
MDDPSLVCCLQCLANLFRNRQCFINRYRSPRYAIREGLPFDQLHHKQVSATGFFQPMNRCNVGMVQRSQHAGFALESSKPVCVVSESFG